MLTPRLYPSLLALLLLTAPLALQAFEFAAPTGPVVLTVTLNDGPEGQVALDVDQLAALGAVSFETTTIWTEGVQRFTGVPLTTLLQALDVAPDSIRASAINDYSVEIPTDGSNAEGAVIAYLHNDTPMSVRDKGPLWIVYPFDSNPDYQSDVVYARSIWQLDRIAVGP